MSSFVNSNTNLDNLLLQALMGRLQIRPPNHHHNPLLSHKSLEDLLLFDSPTFSDDDDENDDGAENDGDKTLLAKEESRLEKEIVRLILAGNSDRLRPNSGQAVAVGDHHVCVGFHEEKGSDYRVWEWHGHIMLFDDDNGYTPEYIYGNYFERFQLPNNANKARVSPAEEEEEEEEAAEEKVAANLGLRELIDGGEADSGRTRVLHRNINAGSSSRLSTISTFSFVF